MRGYKFYKEPKGEAVPIETVRSEHLATLKEWVTEHKTLKQNDKEILLQYIPFFFAQYANGVTGEENLYSAMGYVHYIRPEPGPSGGAAEPERPVRPEPLKDIEEKKLALLSTLLESATAYADNPGAIYAGHPYSCMPGLDERIVDMMGQVMDSVYGVKEKLSLGDMYVCSAVDPFLSKSADGIEASELLYCAWMKAAGYAFNEQNQTRPICLVEISTPAYRQAQHAYITDRIKILNIQLAEYQALCQETEETRSGLSPQEIQQKRIRTGTLKNALAQFIVPKSEPLRLQPEETIIAQCEAAFQALHAQYQGMPLQHDEILKYYVPALNWRYFVLLDATAAPSAKPPRAELSQEEVLHNLSKTLDLEPDHIAALCVFASGKVYNPDDMFEVMKMCFADHAQALRLDEVSFRTALETAQGEILTLDTAFCAETPDGVQHSIVKGKATIYIAEIINVMIPANARLLGSDRLMWQYVESEQNAASALVLQKLAFRCAEQGYIQTLSSILEKHPDWRDHTEDDIDRQTLVQKACDNNQIEIVDLLLKAGANIDASNPHQYSPLQKACLQGHTETVTVLLDRGANIERSTGNGMTPLHIACDNGHAEAVTILLDRGAHIEACTRINMDGKTPLHFACERGYHEIVKILLDRGANPEILSMVGETPLHIACERGDLAMVKIFLEKRANIEAPNMDGKTPLHLACERGYHEIVKILLDRGANIEAPAIYGKTLLNFACERGDLEAVKILLDRGANIEALTIYGKTPVSICRRDVSGNQVKALLQKVANIEALDINGYTPLYDACRQNDREMMKILLDRGANIEAPNRDGMTPLHIACDNGHAEAVQILLDRGAHIEAFTSDGKTPLDIACLSRCVDIGSDLVLSGANIEGLSMKNIILIGSHKQSVENPMKLYDAILESLKEIYAQQPSVKNLAKCMAVQSIILPPYWPSGVSALIAMKSELTQRAWDYTLDDDLEHSGDAILMPLLPPEQPETLSSPGPSPSSTLLKPDVATGEVREKPPSTSLGR